MGRKDETEREDKERGSVCVGGRRVRETSYFGFIPAVPLCVHLLEMPCDRQGRSIIYQLLSSMVTLALFCFCLINAAGDPSQRICVLIIMCIYVYHPRINQRSWNSVLRNPFFCFLRMSCEVWVKLQYGNKIAYYNSGN